MQTFDLDSNSSIYHSDLHLPENVNPVLTSYLKLIERDPSQRVAGLYLHGSLALGVFCPGQSDVDFIAVLTHAANQADFDHLEQVHRHVASDYPSCAMEGSYLQWHDLGLPARQINPYPCYHDGRMYRASRHDINPITWWMLKHRALTVFGPEPQSLGFAINWVDVRAYMITNLHTYWTVFASPTRSPVRFLWLLTDSGVQWAVLGISRLLYGLREGDMISKSQAGEYALTQVPQKWHPLVHEALNIQRGTGLRTYRSAWPRARDTAAYVRYIIAYATG